MAGGQGERKDILNVYKKLQESTLQIQTPEPELDLAFHWAKVAFDNLIVDNPTLGKGLVAGLGASGSTGLGALEYGALTGIETDIYLAAVWVRAAMSMQRMAEAVGDKTLDRTAAQQFKQAKKAFEEKFWDKDSQFYVYTFNTEGKHVQEISPWNAVGLMWELGNPQHIEQKPLLSAP